MTKKALEANALLCDNNTVKIHYVNQSDFLKNKLGFLDKIFSINCTGLKTNSLTSLFNFIHRRVEPLAT